MVRKGIPDREIMRQLGIQTRASLRRMYYDALVEAGKIKDIMTEREVNKAPSFHLATQKLFSQRAIK
ncbi:MAG: hypothetical protein ACETWD_11330 [Desulfatiglandales bacterium]